MEKDELNRVLQKLCEEITGTDITGDSDKAKLHSCFIENEIDNNGLRAKGVSIAQINERFKTSFQNGLFRFLIMKLDAERYEGQERENISSVLEKLISMGMQNLGSCCLEVIYSKASDRIMFLINYMPERDQDVRTSIQELYSKAKHIADLFYGLNLTLCAGAAVDGLSSLEKAKTSCLRAAWLRMAFGVNRVIFEEQAEDAKLGGFSQIVGKIRESLEKAYVSMERDEVSKQLRQFFQLPTPVVSSTEAMMFLYGTVEYFGRVYGDVTQDAEGGRETVKELKTVIESQLSFSTCAEVLSSAIGGCLDKMVQFVRGKTVRPVLKAAAYVEQHYGEHITLEDIAGQVNLSPIYFSGLFKRETGKTFTEYLTDFRIEKGKELLRNSDMNISEIAQALGYQDARYFSKVFKGQVGVKPTDYRKIYG